jgi:site-specific DNA recombinase
MYVRSNSPKYVCHKCRSKIPADDLDAVFHEQIRDFLFSPDEIAAHLDRANESIAARAQLLSVLTTERNKVSTEIDKLYELYQADAIDKRGFAAKSQPLSERFAQLEEQLPVVQAEVDVLKIGQLSQREVLSEARDLHPLAISDATEKRRVVDSRQGLTEFLLVDRYEPIDGFICEFH